METSGPIPAIPTNQIYNRTFTDFYSTAASSPMVQYSTVKKSSAGRKPKEEDNMEDDDDDKRLKRRQRNKEAAARCRQRRIDLMKELQDQVNDFKNSNDKKMAECNNIRNKLNSLKNYLETHDCKLSREERTHEINRLIIPPSTVPPSQPYLQHSLRVHPPRADSVPYSIRSGHSSSSSEQHSPVEDYKPSIDQLLLPPISCIQNIKDRNINSMPPPALPASTSAAGIHVITSIPVSHANSLHGRSENVFAEPERKIPKIELDQTLTSLTMPDDVERPSALPTLSRIVENQPITTPSRPFRLGGEYQNQTPQSTGNGLFGGPPGPFDLLSSNTGLTPSGQPTMNFVSTPTPIQPHPDADLRPL